MIRHHQYRYEDKEVIRYSKHVLRTVVHVQREILKLKINSRFTELEIRKTIHLKNNEYVV